MRPVLQTDPGWWGMRLEYLQLPQHAVATLTFQQLKERSESLGAFHGIEVRDRFGTLVARYTNQARRNNWKES